ncbi:hypothetical protein F5Y18DRAFT_440834 [Xylariaceae sp. FL1019]|nr:hypothetical protein F5Y18DRAFT_440834 [Xylariaceae sp. FL1019]
MFSANKKNMSADQETADQVSPAMSEPPYCAYVSCQTQVNRGYSAPENHPAPIHPQAQAYHQGQVHYGMPMYQIAPVTQALPSDSGVETNMLQLGDMMGFRSINEHDPRRSTSVDFVGDVVSPEPQHQELMPEPPTIAGPSTQVMSRGKRPSKYGDEPPQSIYGPPFVTKELTAGMCEEEMRARVEYNAKVSQARKVFMRAKNNLAAKKSRERKQALIDDLTNEVQRLTIENRHLDALNHDIADQATRAHAAEVDNAHLRQENEGLRVHVEELTVRLNEMTLERRRDAQRLNAMLSVPQSSSQAQATIAEQQNRHQEPEPEQEEQEEEVMDPFLANISNNGGDFNWDRY